MPIICRVFWLILAMIALVLSVTLLSRTDRWFAPPTKILRQIAENPVYIDRNRTRCGVALLGVEDRLNDGHTERSTGGQFGFALALFDRIGR